MRPDLDKHIAPAVFLDYYWLKAELQAFCKQQGIPSSGSKQELTRRIHTYLKTGKVEKSRSPVRLGSKSGSRVLSLDLVIGPDYKSDERHRAFFKEVIGKRFKFNVPFMNWMKASAGRTYQEAVDEWHRIDQAKRAGHAFEIASQFEYNQYMRDFFAAYPDQTREAAIQCWREKRSRPGSNTFEPADIDWLSQGREDPGATSSIE